MDSKILLGKILQKFSDQKVSKVGQYNSFGYIRETNKAVHVTREDGKNTTVPFSKIIIAIDAFKENPELYLEGPGKLRDFGITHVNSPVWSMLHLISVEEYQK